jgi:hypothetical protein
MGSKNGFKTFEEFKQNFTQLEKRLADGNIPRTANPIIIFIEIIRILQNVFFFKDFLEPMADLRVAESWISFVEVCLQHFVIRLLCY